MSSGKNNGGLNSKDLGALDAQKFDHSATLANPGGGAAKPKG